MVLTKTVTSGMRIHGRRGQERLESEYSPTMFTSHSLKWGFGDFTLTSVDTSATQKIDIFYIIKIPYTLLASVFDGLVLKRALVYFLCTQI